MLSTLAIELLLVDHVIVLFCVVLLGVIVAFIELLAPFFIVTVVGFTVTPVIGITVGVTGCVSVFGTVTVHVAVFPLLALAVITAVPSRFAVTFPVLSTVATKLLLVIHVISLSVASVGLYKTLSCDVFPFSSVNLFVFKLTLIKGDMTLTYAVPFIP